MVSTLDYELVSSEKGASQTDMHSRLSPYGDITTTQNISHDPSEAHGHARGGSNDGGKTSLAIVWYVNPKMLGGRTTQSLIPFCNFTHTAPFTATTEKAAKAAVL